MAAKKRDWVNTYDSKVFSPDEQPIAAKIQQRRLQILVHSYIYYDLDMNIISDDTWSSMAKDLYELQKTYPDIAEKVNYADEFKDFDPSTGYNLNFRQPQIIDKAERLIDFNQKVKTKFINMLVNKGSNS